MLNSLTYTGYKEIQMTDDEMSKFYSNLDDNRFGCLVNEYIIVCNSVGEIVDYYRWNGSKFCGIYSKSIKSQIFGDAIKPKDIYQSFVVDSIMTNMMTAITGKQGSGKSLLSIACALSLIEARKYDSLTILFNPTKVRGVTDLGFYKGSALDKAMQTSIGNTLISKFGDAYGVDTLIQHNKLKLISMGDIRGMEVGSGSILYLTEAQNTSIDIIKLCLGRVCEGAKVIIEGDYKAQVDKEVFANDNNGLKRVIDVLKGEDLFGYIDLQNVWRSRLVALLDRL